MKKKQEKKEPKICMPLSEYRRLRRREGQILRARAHIREGWRVLSKIAV